jgi:hypothetical protein
MSKTTATGLVRNEKSKAFEQKLLTIELTRKAFRQLGPWLKRNRLSVGTTDSRFVEKGDRV